MEFDTEDPATRYQNGILSDLDALAIKRFKNGLGVGFVGAGFTTSTSGNRVAGNGFNFSASLKF
jgi:hypothetical protein